MRNACLFLCLLTWLPSAGAQNSTAQDAYLRETPEPRAFDQGTWRENTRTLHYEVPPARRSRKNTPMPPDSKKGNPFQIESATGTWMQVLSIVLLGIAIAVLLRKLLAQPRNPKIKPHPIALHPDDLDADLPEDTLRTLLEQAIAKGQFALAVRIYFLRVLQELQRTRYIRWKKDKTNRDYLREIREPALASEFRTLTYFFERVRYGGQTPGASEFEAISPRFIAFLEKLKAIPPSQTPEKHA
jgi:hypothetical protein